jgi:N-dimethylarginine dimethylaminohydrolase
MVAPLLRVAVCSPRTAGWNQPERLARWQELGFHHAPDFERAQAQHGSLHGELSAAGAEVIDMIPGADLSLDAVYAHDASLPTAFGLILMRPGKANRIAEGKHHGLLSQTLGIPILGEITAPATTEAGDMIWLHPNTLLIGHGFRSNAAGIQQMRDLLAPAGETVELLKSRGFGFIEIEYSERDTLACNVLALGNKRLLAIEENRKTNARLRRAGFDVRTFPASEICINGSGGPTCLTRPLLRG